MSTKKRCKANLNRQFNSSHSPKRKKMSPDLPKMLTVVAEAEEAVAAEEAADRSQKIKELKGKLSALHDQNKKLEVEINKLRNNFQKKSTQQNDAVSESQNQKQGETNCVFEFSTVNLQEELQKVTTASNTSRDQNDNLQDKINELEKEMEKKSMQENNATTSQNQILGETSHVAQSSTNQLWKELQEIKKENNQLRKDIKKLQCNVTKLTNKFLSVTKSNKSLKKTVRKHQQIEKKLKEMETRLALGQVAWCLEKEIWKAVLPNEEMGRTCIFQSMEQWLLENSSLSEGQEAEQRWKDLQDKLGWKDSIHRYGLKLLKEVRSSDAHPENVDLKEAKKQLKEGDYIPGPFKKRCEEIIDMVINAQQLNSSRSK